jgi:hypothetical protein
LNRLVPRLGVVVLVAVATACTRLVDTTIVVASFAWFFLLFLGFIKPMPSLSIVEMKERLTSPRSVAAGGPAPGILRSA